MGIFPVSHSKQQQEYHYNRALNFFKMGKEDLKCMQLYLNTQLWVFSVRSAVGKRQVIFFDDAPSNA